MRVLLGFPQQDLQTGAYIKRAFETLGHTVFTNDPRETPSSAGRIVYEAGVIKPDFILLAKDPRYNGVIEELSKHNITVVWNVDTRYDISVFLQTCGPLYRYARIHFTIGKGNIDDYRKAGVKNIHWLSEGIDPTVHYPVEYTADDILKYSADIAFAGSLGGPHNGREEVIKEIQRSYSSFILYCDLFNLDHSKMVQLTKINIGHSGWEDVELSMSARDYRIMGAGGFLLTNYVKGIESWFDPGMCAMYDHPEGCIEAIGYYLEHEQERKEIAARGCKIVHEKHKFSDRLQEMIQYVKDYV